LLFPNSCDLDLVKGIPVCLMKREIFKFEARNPKSETNSNDRKSKFETMDIQELGANKNTIEIIGLFWSFGHLNFGFVSNFDIRIL